MCLPCAWRFGFEERPGPTLTLAQLCSSVGIVVAPLPPCAVKAKRAKARRAKAKAKRAAKADRDARAKAARAAPDRTAEEVDLLASLRARGVVL